MVRREQPNHHYGLRHFLKDVTTKLKLLVGFEFDFVEVKVVNKLFTQRPLEIELVSGTSATRRAGDKSVDMWGDTTTSGHNRHQRRRGKAFDNRTDTTGGDGGVKDIIINRGVGDTGKRVRKHATMRVEPPADRLTTEQHHGQLHHSVGEPLRIRRLHHSVAGVVADTALESLRIRRLHHSVAGVVADTAVAPSVTGVVADTAVAPSVTGVVADTAVAQNVTGVVAKKRGQLDAGTFHSSVEVEPPADLLSKGTTADTAVAPSVTGAMADTAVAPSVT
eukprot:scaffold33521_cov130-Skeletonema_dohrnii-CCMP3373.AAC.1